MSEPAAGTVIAACARGWVGTRFHHQGRLKRTANHAGGVDCLGLLIGVADELDLHGFNGIRLADLDRCDYGHIPSGEELKNALDKTLRNIPLGGICAGDILLLAPDEVPRHLAIVGESENGLTLIHAYAQARKVAEHTFDAWWRGKLHAAYRVCLDISSLPAPDNPVIR